jgi:ubiquitin
MWQGHDGKRAWLEVSELAEKEVKPDLASMIAEIAREECRKLYEKRLTGLEEELAALYRTLEQYTHPT